MLISKVLPFTAFPTVNLVIVGTFSMFHRMSIHLLMSYLDAQLLLMLSLFEEKKQMKLIEIFKFGEQLYSGLYSG